MSPGARYRRYVGAAEEYKAEALRHEEEGDHLEARRLWRLADRAEHEAECALDDLRDRYEEEGTDDE